MYPEDAVLVAYLPRPADFIYLQEQGWYRIPQAQAPRGLYAPYVAFYFSRHFGDQKWAVHYYGRNLGHELVTRRMLLPDEPDHPRADEAYYKIQIGELTRLPKPIISLRWRRITFIHTTWDRFQAAQEINDLFLEGGEYVDRLYALLKEHGVQPVRHYRVEEAGGDYLVPLAVWRDDGQLLVSTVPTNEFELHQITADLLQKMHQ